MRIRTKKGKFIDIPDGPTPEEELEMEVYAQGAARRLNTFDGYPKNLRDKGNEDPRMAAVMVSYPYGFAGQIFVYEKPPQ